MPINGKRNLHYQYPMEKHAAWKKNEVNFQKHRCVTYIMCLCEHAYKHGKIKRTGRNMFYFSYRRDGEMTQIIEVRDQKLDPHQTDKHKEGPQTDRQQTSGVFLILLTAGKDLFGFSSHQQSQVQGQIGHGYQNSGPVCLPMSVQSDQT